MPSSSDQVPALSAANSFVMAASASSRVRNPDRGICLRLPVRPGNLALYRSKLGHRLVDAGPVCPPPRLVAAGLTDGAARIVRLFGLLSWRELLDAVDAAGPADILHRVRSVEASDPLGSTWPRNKRSDDATIVYAIDPAHAVTPDTP
jgi:hypothetical protein